MAYESLKTAVDAVITTNGTNDITGSILRTLIDNNLIPVLGESHYKGVATPSTTPSTPETDVYYFAKQGGTYTNFGAAAINTGLSILSYSTSLASWSAVQLIDSTNFLENGGYGGDAQDLYDLITTNITDIAAAAADISTNAANIATNTSGISGNTLAIGQRLEHGGYGGNAQDLKDDIDANTDDISTNTGNISTNTGNISTNTTNISAAQGTIDAMLTLFKAVSGATNSATAGDFISITMGGDPKEVDLPASPNTNDIVRVTIKDGAGGTLTVDGNGNNINGVASETFSTQYEVRTYQYDGSEWIRY